MIRIPAYPKGAPVDVFFEYDHNGTIYVSVFDLNAKKMLGEVYGPHISNLTEQEVQEKQRKLERIGLSIDLQNSVDHHLVA